MYNLGYPRCILLISYYILREAGPKSTRGLSPKGIVPASGRLGLRVKEGGGCEVGGVSGGRVRVCGTG